MSHIKLVIKTVFGFNYTKMTVFGNGGANHVLTLSPYWTQFLSKEHPQFAKQNNANNNFTDNVSKYIQLVLNENKERNLQKNITLNLLYKVFRYNLHGLLGLTRLKKYKLKNDYFKDQVIG